MSSEVMRPGALTAEVSFGLDVMRPAELKTVATGDILEGIRDGQWREPVERVRALEGTARVQAKKCLPYWTPSGRFSYRRESGLVKHSGQIAVDLDHVPAQKRREAIHVAVDDPYCSAAFLSASAEGVRLVFRIAPCTARQHSTVFDQVAQHVRRHYGIEPDLSCRDVCRPSFVSCDEGLWFRGNAHILPVELVPEPEGPDTVISYCVRRVSPPWWIWMAKDATPHVQRTEGELAGTYETHDVLLDLAWRLTLRASRNREGLPVEMIEAIGETWYQTCRERGFALRGSCDEYTKELTTAVYLAPKNKLFSDAARVWTQWTEHADLPKDGTAVEKIWFAIQKHCEARRCRKFFLSARDGASIAGVGRTAASAALWELCRMKRIKRTGNRFGRQAQEFEVAEGKAKP